ncbi:MAG: single-stranded-DNA-specific exonuclease RecJ [Dehalococcoidia bacterium]
MITTGPELGVSGKRWRLRGRFPEGELSEAPYPPLVRHLLWHRGLRTVAAASRFLDGSPPSTDEYDPLLLPGMEVALTRLRQAIQDDEPVAVFGDFDVDGVTATALLTDALRRLGATVLPYLPDRFAEGYGLNLAAIDSLRQAGIRLLVTVDCGSSSLTEIDYAVRIGMEVVVVDHHTVPPQLPAAIAIINPRRAENRYPEPELTSVGLAYKLVAALYESLGQAWEPRRYLDLVALGTIADVAPLQNENRSLVKRGLAALSATERPGLRALIEDAGIDPTLVDAEAVGYALGPRLNAAGRLAHARQAFDLLLEEDEEKARQQALALTTLNRQRQRQTLAAMELAQELLAKEDAEAPLLFIGHKDISSGIVGLVAGRLAEERYRPAVVYEVGDGTSRASCRSIPEFDITSALRKRPELMVRFGGHRAAAGFTAENDKLPALKESLLAQAGEALTGLELAPTLDIDAAVPLHRMSKELLRWLPALAPFGQGNPEPTFLSRGLEVVEARVLGNDSQHLRLKLRDGSVTWPAIAFGFGPAGRAPINAEPGRRLDVVYSFAADRFGRGALELRVKDMAPTGQA